MSLQHEETADRCLKERKFAEAVHFNQLAGTPQLERIANFAYLGYCEEVVGYLKVLLSTKASDIPHADKGHFANLAVSCFVDLYLKENTDANLTALKKFLKEYNFYDEQLAIRLFIERDLYDLAEYCAELRLNHACLLENLLTKATALQLLEPVRTDSSAIRTGDETPTPQVQRNVFPASDAFFRAITSPSMSYAVLSKPSLLDKYVRLLIRSLPSFNVNLLRRVAVCFDSRRASIQLLLNRILPRIRHQYLTDDVSEADVVSKKDILNFYVFLLLLIDKKSESKSSFSEHLVSFVERRCAKETVIPNRDITLSKNKLDTDLVAVAAGQSHCAAVRNGMLFMWGRGQLGRLGFSGADTTLGCSEPPTLVEFFAQNIAIAVNKISCGATHTLVLTDYGLYAFGSSRFGQLGIGDEVQFTHRPSLVEDLLNEEISEVRCGQYHSLIVTHSGELFTFGWGIHGQLGLGSAENVSRPTKVDFFEAIRVVDAAGGYCHSLVLDDTGVVFAFGNGMFGQLGIGTCSKYSIPQRVYTLPEPAKLIVTHYFHNVVLTTNKRLFCWGAHPQTVRLQAHAARKARQKAEATAATSTEENVPQLPPPNALDHLSPLEISRENLNSEIIKISVGAMHCMLLTKNRQVFTWGRGMDGQLGRGPKKEIPEPSLISDFIGKKIVDIDAGYDFSLAVDSTGRVWGWGQNSDGQLGPPRQEAQVVGAKSPKTERKLTVKTSRRLITLPLSRSTHIELVPFQVFLPDPTENDGYQESLNYSIDIRAMKCCATPLVTNPSLDVITPFNISNEALLAFDKCTLADFVVNHRSDLDLGAVLKRCVAFSRHQYAALVHELRGELDCSLRSHLAAIDITQESAAGDVAFVFESHMRKVLLNASLGKRTIGVLFEFWKSTSGAFDIQTLLLSVYREKLRNFAFGVILLQYLSRNEAELKGCFARTFLLDVLCDTLAFLDAVDCSDSLMTPPIMELISTADESLVFPAEQMWQSILKNITQGVRTLESS